ncbi:MAG: nucleoside-diphosphate sugar epimerase/dehydratase [Armatimonadota bacterium]|nr:nucleoside-diphosphate sugar epimerase/dehydratase [Armatimonadota bacterium]
MRAFDIRPTPAVRAAVFLAGDLFVWCGALWAAFLIRFDGRIPPRYLAAIPLLLAVLIPAKLAWQSLFRLYQMTWRTVSITEMLNVVKANTLALLTTSALFLLLRSVEAFRIAPRSVLLMDWILTMVGVTAFRASRRIWELQRNTLRGRGARRNGTRLLIVGAGAAGTRIAQTIQDAGGSAYHLVGFVDDDPAKRGAYVLGLRVFGGRDVLARVIRERAVEQVLIAIPSAPPQRLRDIVEDVRKTGIRSVKILPGMHEWLSGRLTLRDIREVNVQDLLGRPPVQVRYDALRAYYRAKRVLVTGAAGSIGSELVRQLLRFEVDRIVAADINETGLFELDQELRGVLSAVPLQITLADVRDEARVDHLMRTVRPHVVFHAAAYKHVPLMERDVEEAVKTNVFGTLNVSEAALGADVGTFVFISTDKAVNPASVMGASKRVGELLTQALGRRGKTRFVAVRFGNVLGSRGSLIPLLQEQIRRGGPVTITHPDMVRYFMSIAEAVLLVLQTPLMRRPEALFMLDMGEPVRVLDVVRELIRLSGLEVDRDIPIVYSGIRDGEKLEEELVTATERPVATDFERILAVESAESVDEVTLRLALRELERLVRVMDGAGVRAVLERIARLSVVSTPPMVTSGVRGTPVAEARR